MCTVASRLSALRVIAEMMHKPQGDTAVINLDQFPPDQPPKRRTSAEKARILANLVLILVALDKEERYANGNA